MQILVRKAKSLEFSEFGLKPGEFNYITTTETSEYDSITYGYGKSVFGSIFDLISNL